MFSRSLQGITEFQFLHHGVSKLNHGVSKLNHGVSKLNHGVSKLNHGVSKLNHGVSKLNHGVSNLKTPSFFEGPMILRLDVPLVGSDWINGDRISGFFYNPHISHL